MPLFHNVIQNPATKLVLRVLGDIAKPGARVIGQVKQEGHESQHWFADPVTQTIRSALSYEYCLDIKDGRNVVINPYNAEQTSQLWFYDGRIIQSVSDKNMVIELVGTQPGAEVINATWKAVEGQILKFMPVPNEAKL